MTDDARTWPPEARPARLSVLWTFPLDARRAAALLVGALLLGVLAEILFYGERFGLNVPIWTAAVLLAARAVRPPGATMDRADLWLGPAAMAFAAFCALRADPLLLDANLLATGGLGTAAAAAIAGVPITRRSAGAIVLLAILAIGLVLGGAVRLRPGLRPWSRRLSGLPAGDGWRAVRGLLIALPFVAACALLFAAADAVFAELLGSVLGVPFDVGELSFRIAFIAIAAWLAGGLLVLAAAHAPADQSGVSQAHSVVLPRLGAMEGVVALIALDALFAVFVVLQATYLFGGRDTLEASGLTYSAYARRGFFELIAVAGIAGTLVLGLEATVRARTRAYLLAALLLGALTLAVLLSALVRLGLYNSAYGWTELRFHALAAIAWLGIGVVIAAGTIVLDRSRWLLHGLVIAGLAVALGVNAVGPQEFVAGRNLERAIHPELVPSDGLPGLDAAHLGTLDEDAVPALVASLPSLSEPDRAAVLRILRFRLARLDADSRAGSWASWNLGRERAREALEPLRPQLEAMRGP